MLTRSVRLGLFLSLLLAASGCSKGDKSPKPERASTAPPDVAATEAASGEKAADEPGAEHGPLTWIHDDYDGALAQAKAAGKPLFIDMWAPWCHTCLSMQSYVFSDPSLADVAGDFVWLAIDTDKPENAAVQTRLPVPAWPTFYILSSVDESVQVRHVGSVPLPALRELLREGEDGHLDAQGRAGSLTPALAARRDGDRAAVAGHFADAEAAFARALELGGTAWSRRPEVLLDQLLAVSELDPARCAELGLSHLAEVAASKNTTLADYADTVLRCATRAGGELAQRTTARLGAEGGPLHTLLAASDSRLSADDRSATLGILRAVAEARGDEGEARQWAEKQRAVLDAAAAAAPDALVAMTYNWPRAEVYVYLGETEALIPDMKKSVEALPDQYDPPYRLAWLYLNDGEYDLALASAEQALKRVYGPRKGSVLKLIADIHHARHDLDAERKTRAQLVDYYASLPPGHARKSSLERARQALSALH